MNRSAVIATVVATTGVLVAGSVASVAVINAASSSEPATSGITLVADGAVATTTDGTSALAPSADSAVDLPTLPSQPAVPELATVAPAADTGSGSANSGSGAADDRGTDSASPAASRDTTSVSSRQAARTVLAETGGSVMSVSKSNRGGYSAWAVTVKRPDGSVITGYVDRASGVVFDWVVNQNAPSRPSSNSGSNSSDDDSDEAENEQSDDSDEAENEQSDDSAEVEDDEDDHSQGSDDSSHASDDNDESEYEGDDD